jgi:hypothetical protein
MWPCTLKLNEEKWKHAGLARQKGFLAQHLWTSCWSWYKAKRTCPPARENCTKRGLTVAPCIYLTSVLHPEFRDSLHSFCFCGWRCYEGICSNVLESFSQCVLVLFFFLLRKEDPTRQRVTGFPNHLACGTFVALIKSTKSLDIQSVYHYKHQLMDLHKHIEFSLCLILLTYNLASLSGPNNIKNIIPTFRRWKSCDLKMVVRVCTMSKYKHGQNIQTNQISVSLSIETFEHLYFSISHSHTLTQLCYIISNSHKTLQNAA